jgi:hypothetical protein
MKSLTWPQVHAWRLSQHCLTPRLPRRHFLEAASRVCGIQAQVMSAAELALWARADGLTPEEVQSALWKDRTLLKTWAMRGTLHLLSAADLPLYAAALTAYGSRDWLKYFIYFGISDQRFEEFLAAAPQVLGSEPMTREQLATAMAQHMGAPEMANQLLASSWGSLWKPLAWRGDLCFGPNRGRSVTFVRPSAWFGEWQPRDPQEAFQEIARRYLRAYGPATPENFALWWSGGAGLTATRKLFRSLAGELEEVDVEGWRAYALRSTLERVRELAEPAETVVRLLPLFDAYTLGTGRDLEPLLPNAYKTHVFRPQGWISAVVLVNGRMDGVWEYETRRSQTVVKVRMFAPPAASLRKGIEAEAERLSPYLNTEVAVQFE